MRLLFWALLIFPAFLANSSDIHKQKGQDKITYTPKDKEIFSQIVTKFQAEKNLSTAELVVKIGSYFRETPYVAHTLEFEPEHLVINLRELDCTTFAENCLALARTIKSNKQSFSAFTSELKKIRYHNGKINEYPSRIHYFSDWIFENSKKGMVTDVTKTISGDVYPMNINIMSTHPDSYFQLKGNASFIKEIVENEKVISQRIMYFIPEEKLSLKEEQLKDGDIAGITTTIKGIDIQHVVILIKKNGRVHILHASQSAGKVLISDETLEDYLLKSKSATGIMVARPL